MPYSSTGTDCHWGAATRACSAKPVPANTPAATIAAVPTATMPALMSPPLSLAERILRAVDLLVDEPLDRRLRRPLEGGPVPERLLLVIRDREAGPDENGEGARADAAVVVVRLAVLAAAAPGRPGRREHELPDADRDRGMGDYEVSSVGHAERAVARPRPSRLVDLEGAVAGGIVEARIGVRP